MPTKVGTYAVYANNAAVRFWPLVPGTTLAATTPQAHVAPDSQNTLVMPPIFGIFDIVIRLSEDTVITEEVEESETTDRLLTVVEGNPPETTMSLWREDDGYVHISFAVTPNQGNFFEGELRLEARYSTTRRARLALPLKVEQMTRAADMFIFFIVHRKPSRTYCWFKIKVVEQSDGVTPVRDVTVLAKVLRDNLSSGYDKLNRRVALANRADGFVAFWRGTGNRPVLAFPIDWPLIFNAVKDDFAPSGYVPRGHMIRLTSDAISDNLAPHETSPIRMIRTRHASMATRRVLLDPGHGVVYALTTARRSQEWYVAHRIADRIADLLETHFGLPAANLFWTRTAGFGLIEPGSLSHNNAPEQGALRYEFNLTTRQVRIKQTALGLHHLSTLLLTRHADDNTAQAVTEADRNRLITINATTVNAIIARINATLPTGQRVRPGSVRWHAADGHYVYTRERITPGPGENPVVDNAVPFRIRTTDWFTVDDDMIEVLAERSARWSLTHEIGSGPAAVPANPATGQPARPSFSNAARAAMRDAGALAYMRERIVQEISITHPTASVNRTTKAWGPSHRISYINNLNPACDIYLTLHENAGGGKGGMVLVSHKGGADAPPDDQVRIAKIFAKYLDGFDQGLRQGGVVKDLPGNPAGMLYSGNQVRESYAYFEMEFMDAINPDNLAQYRYQQMVRNDFVDCVARQIVAGVVEVLFDRQADLDSVTYKSELTLW